MSYGRIVKKNPAHVCAGFFLITFIGVNGKIQIKK